LREPDQLLPYGEPIKPEVDRIWHLAVPAFPVHYQFNPVKTAKTSFIGTYNMLGLVRRVGWAVAVGQHQ
jgi:UDP-glucuronate decarboxylase